MKHPLDQFLHASLSNVVENEVPSFEAFQEKLTHAKEDQSLDQWLKNQTNSAPLENPNFAEFLKYQENQESATHPLDEWLHTQSSQHPKSGRFPFQEFKSYWNGMILKKWSKRVAILLLLLFSGWTVQKFKVNEEGHLGIGSESKRNLHQAQPNLSLQPKTGTISGLVGATRGEKLAHRISILHNNSKAEKSTFSQTHSFNARPFEPIQLNSKETVRNKLKLKKSVESIETKLTSNFNKSEAILENSVSITSSGAILENSGSITSKGKIVVENLEFFPLKSKTRLIHGNFQRMDDLPIVKSNNMKRNFLQLSLSSGSTNQKLEYFGEKNKHWDPLQSWKVIPQMNIGILWIKPMNKGFGAGFGAGISTSTLKKEIEYHITEIPVLDSATGTILGYIPLGPRGQIHKEEQVEVTQNRMNLQGAFYKSWKINPSFEWGIQQNLGMGIQKMNILQIVDPISLESSSMTSKIEWEAIGKSSIWIQSRLAEHWGIGAQIGRPFSVKFSNKNSLIFREMSIFEAGVSVRYYLKSK